MEELPLTTTIDQHIDIGAGNADPLTKLFWAKLVIFWQIWLNLGKSD